MSSNGIGQQRRPGKGRKRDLRLEGLIVEKRLTHIETTRYLVIDFSTGSVSVYKKPPPKDEYSAMQSKKNRSVPSKIISSFTGSFSRSSSDGDGAGGKSISFQNLAHLSRQPRHFASGTWEPKFTASSKIDWKIRDVENDETMFYLVMPSDFKKLDAEAEVYTLQSREGNRVSFRSMRDLNAADVLGSINENEEAATGGAGGIGSSGRRGNNVRRDSDDNSSESSPGRKKRKSVIPFGRNRVGSQGEQEVIYQFRVLLDGNEKFIWLQAAAELGRLCSDTAVSVLSTTVDVTKKIFVLPMAIGTGRSKLTALRYAEWARLIDQQKNVSRVQFDVLDTSNIREPQDGGGGNPMDDSGRYNATKLVKVIPTYAYRNRRMTEKDLYHEMTTTSERWEDFRNETVGDREDEKIGSLHVEVLACHGLPKLDKLSSTDAVCYFVCGPFAFASDVIDGFLSPVWPSKSRRACIFPIFHAYQKLYAGIFDDDGPAAHDDFAGRVVIDMSRLRPNAVYDVFLPLRMYQNTYVKKPRGVIRLRLRLEWDDERKAFLSYLKRPQKIDQLGNAVTVNCADYKGFRNVVLTVQGKDVPGRYKQLIQKGLQREMKLYKMVMKTTMKEQMLDIVLYVNPSTSFCIFMAWMHCVYSNSLAYVPVYFVAGIIALLLRNYMLYGIDEDFNFGFHPITIKEMFQVLLYGGPGTKYIKPIEVKKQGDGGKSARRGSGIAGEDELHESVFQGDHSFRMDGDHMEFPFSEAGRYAKKTLAEACVDASALFLEDDDDDAAPKGALSSFRKKAKKSSQAMRLPKALREEDNEEEEMDEFGLMVKSSVDTPNADPNANPNDPNALNESADVQIVDKSIRATRRKSSFAIEDMAAAVSAEVPVKPWKRVTDTRGLPEQDATVFVKSRKTLKEELEHNRGLMHKYSQYMFDDRMFIVNEDDEGYKDGEELALNQAVGTNKYKSPIVAKIAEYIAPALEMLKVGLSVWRAGFNLFTWRDPFLTSLFLFGSIALLCVLLVFPWRLFFFVIGFGAVGPQNWLVRIYKNPLEKKKKKKPERKSVLKMTNGPTKQWHFHNHLTTDQGVDLREKREEKSTSVHRAVVPNAPLLSRRFYDWPPNPSLSKVDIYKEGKQD